MGLTSLRRHHAAHAASPRPPSPFVPREEHEKALAQAGRDAAKRIAELEAALAAAPAADAIAERDARIAELEAALAAAPAGHGRRR